MTDKSEKRQKSQITLKRKVAVKAVVTEKFKDLLRLELQETLKMAKLRIAEIDNQIQHGDKMASLIPQLVSEKQQLQFSLEQDQAQKDSIERLENGTLFNQGSIEGFVTVYEGDNLYEKIGGMEILVKDGVIEKINSLSVPLSL